MLGSKILYFLGYSLINTLYRALKSHLHEIVLLGIREVDVNDNLKTYQIMAVAYIMCKFH